MSAPWLTVAQHFLGERRVQGPADNADIVEMFRLAGFPHQHDDTAWCAAFVGACLRLSGFANQRTLLAAEYVNFGQALSQPKQGAIVVFKPFEKGTSGHVGFFDHQVGDMIYVLGGNQGGKLSEVRVSGYSASRVRAYRWPLQTADLPTDSSLPTILAIAPAEAPDHVRGGAPSPSPDEPPTRPTPEVPDLVLSDAFDRVQAIIDRFEGGFRQSPDEGGGACNFGITRTTLEAWRQRPVTIEEVHDLTRAEAHDIYRARYWKPIGGAELPQSVVLIVYNLAVLSGPRRAVTFLQRALDQLGAAVTVDGEMGPQTLGVAQQANAADLIDAFAKIEAAFHSASHKTQYISGWLKRLDEIHRAALSWIAEAPSPPSIPDFPTSAQTDEETGRIGSANLAFGASGARVRALQTALRDAGYMLGALDGEFDSLTRGAVLAFQLDNGLPLTGVADAATFSALDKPAERQLTQERITADSADLLKSGSRIVVGANNAKRAGLASSVLGGVGIANSAAVEFAQNLAPGAGHATAASAKALADPGVLIDALQKAAALPKPTTASPEVAKLIDAISALQGSTIDKVLSPETLQFLNAFKKVLPSTELMKASPADLVTLQPIVEFFKHLPEAPSVTAAASNVNTIFDLLPRLFPEGGLQTLSHGLSATADSVVPGFGGSLLTLGLGLAIRYFAGRIIDARVEDHRTGTNMKR